MIFLYRILINFVFIISPLIIIIRLFKGKEDINRFKEKFCNFSISRANGKVIWLHGASVGELQSIIPLLEKLEKDKNIKQILLTSNTLSSSKIINRFKFKKIVHQFFPIDTNFLINKFLNYWKPSAAFFIDSEIWPNTIINLNHKNIPILLLNGRITKKTFKRWYLFKAFSRDIFEKFEVCFSSSIETKKYLKKLGAKQVKFIGNLKFSQSENEKYLINEKFKKFIKKKTIWCASSTHKSEELICGSIHKEMKKKYKNLLTIIIPRHIDRVGDIIKDLNKLNLEIHHHDSTKKININTDIYLVNSYGQTKSFYSICKNIFLGGSLINHGGQNPLEASRFGCNILHGPYVSNFNEIYKFLKIRNVTQKVTNKKNMIKALNNLFKKSKVSKETQKELKGIGERILNSTLNEINFIINKHEIKKT